MRISIERVLRDSRYTREERGTPGPLHHLDDSKRKKSQLWRPRRSEPVGGTPGIVIYLKPSEKVLYNEELSKWCSRQKHRN